MTQLASLVALGEVQVAAAPVLLCSIAQPKLKHKHILSGSLRYGCRSPSCRGF
jgi:hypothetical protein